MDADRFAFVTEWYDQNAALNRRYTLLFYPEDNSVEMIDMKSRRMFLRRAITKDVTLSDLFIGNTANVFSRQLNIIDYGDEFTRDQLGSRQETAVLLVSAQAAAEALGGIVDTASQAGLKLTGAVMTKLSRQDVDELCRRQKPNYNLTDGSMVALEFLGKDAVGVLLSLVPKLNSRYGGGRGDAVQASSTGTDATRESSFFFGQGGAKTAACFNNTALCLIKPHALEHAGGIINDILAAGFQITALQTFRLDRPSAEEFFEVYKGVLSEYTHMVTELLSGTSLALEVRFPEGDTQQQLRELCGPVDPDIGRQIRPNTLRARYGESRVKNAVHCTDLPEDTALELEYFFQIMLN